MEVSINDTPSHHPHRIFAQKPSSYGWKYPHELETSSLGPTGHHRWNTPSPSSSCRMISAGSSATGRPGRVASAFRSTWHRDAPNFLGDMTCYGIWYCGLLMIIVIDCLEDEISFGDVLVYNISLKMFWTCKSVILGHSWAYHSLALSDFVRKPSKLQILAFTCTRYPKFGTFWHLSSTVHHTYFFLRRCCQLSGSIKIIPKTYP